MERHVDPGRDTRRRDDLAAVDEPVVGTHLDGRLELGEAVEPAPPRCCRAVAEEPGGGKGERAGADARHERTPVGIRTKPLQEHLVLELRVDAGAARDEQHVRGRRRVPRVVGRDPEALRALEEIGRVRDGEDRHAVVRMLRRPGREHFPRPGEVELLDPLEEDDGNLRHGAMLEARVLATVCCKRSARAPQDARAPATSSSRSRSSSTSAPRSSSRAAPPGCRARRPARRAASHGNAQRRPAPPRGRPRRSAPVRRATRRSSPQPRHGSGRSRDARRDRCRRRSRASRAPPARARARPAARTGGRTPPPPRAPHGTRTRRPRAPGRSRSVPRDIAPRAGRGRSRSVRRRPRLHRPAARR